MRVPLALVGILVVFAGLHLLWQSRREIFYWIETWSNIFRDSLRDSQRAGGSSLERPRFSRFGSGREHVLRLLLGFSLVLIVGPVLIFLGFLL
jgi:hypothetical protein